jgi:predicted transcriptional regulator
MKYEVNIAMINSKGEVIYTNAEIAYELGLTAATVNAAAKRLFGGGRVPHYTLNDARLIVKYIKSISVEEDAKRLAALHEVVQEVMGENSTSMSDEGTRKRIDNDLYKV